MSADDTIFALASGAGRSAVAVMRLSGAACGRIVGALCTLPPPRQAQLRALRAHGETLDRALVLWFPAPGSYTGEDSAELHLHGGDAVLEAVTEALVERGARPAEPGEFTRRAFLGGKMDLLEAEAVADLVDAETPQQRAQALRQLGGEQGRLLADWTSRLLHSLAMQEAMIDFAEEDLPDVEAELVDGLRRLQRELQQHLSSSRAGERLRRGLVFVITGPPNVGKSSLLNALAGRDAAIVSSSPGTTRDVVPVELVLAGIPVTLVDTAGLRETCDEAEAEGVRRAREQGARADLIIEVSDASAPGAPPSSPGHMHVANKTDLAPPPPGLLGVSVRTGDGIEDLRRALTARARRLAGVGGSPVFNRARHVTALREADGSISAALASAHSEIRAEELRLALQSLGRLNGRVDAEAVLDVVFSSFCIGK